MIIEAASGVASQIVQKSEITRFVGLINDEVRTLSEKFVILESSLTSVRITRLRQTASSDEVKVPILSPLGNELHTILDSVQSIQTLLDHLLEELVLGQEG